jgi:hypothetical protein
MKWHRVNISISKGKKRRIARKHQTKPRPKPSRTSIKSCLYMSGIQDTWCHDVSSEEFGKPHYLLFTTHMVSLLGWLHLLSMAFISKRSMFLASSTSYSLHCIFDFTLTASNIFLPGAACKDPNRDTYGVAS